MPGLTPDFQVVIFGLSDVLDSIMSLIGNLCYLNKYLIDTRRERKELRCNIICFNILNFN